MTQIAEAIDKAIKPLGVGVVVEAQTLVHDDGRGRKTTLFDGNVLHAGCFPTKRDSGRVSCAYPRKRQRLIVCKVSTGIAGLAAGYRTKGCIGLSRLVGF